MYYLRTKICGRFHIMWLAKFHLIYQTSRKVIERMYKKVRPYNISWASNMKGTGASSFVWSAHWVCIYYEVPEKPRGTSILRKPFTPHHFDHGRFSWSSLTKAKQDTRLFNAPLRGGSKVETVQRHAFSQIWMPTFDLLTNYRFMGYYRAVVQV